MLSLLKSCKPYSTLSFIRCALTPVSICVLFTFSLVSSTCVTSQTKTAQCPCTFYVLTNRSAPYFHILVNRTRAPYYFLQRKDNHHLASFNKKLSLLNQSESHATSTNAVFRYHRFPISQRGQFSVTALLEHNLSPAPTFHLSLHLLESTTMRSAHCPVLLPQHPPVPSSTVAQATKLKSSGTFPKAKYNVRNGGSEPGARVGETGRQKIVGGDLTDEKLSKYLARLEENGSPKCSGVIIAPKIVMTAAHCVHNNRDVSILDIYIGGTHFQNDPGVRISVSSVVVHPRYKFVANDDRFPFFDIAYLYLTQAPKPNEYNIMHINTNGSVPVTGSIVRAAGYGVLNASAVEITKPFRGHPNVVHTSNKNMGMDDFTTVANLELRLYQVDVPVVSGDDCIESYKASSIQVNDSRNICAGYLGVGRCDSCYGDSGGPLVQYNSKNEPVLVGLVSSGLGCAGQFHPGVYIRISKYNLFIPRENVRRTTSVVTVTIDSDGHLNSVGNTSFTASHGPSPHPAPGTGNDPGNSNGRRYLIIITSIGGCLILVIVVAITIVLFRKH